MYNNQRTNESHGALFPRDKKGQNSPDMGGEINLDGDVLAYIANELAAGATAIKLYVSTWNKRSRDGGPRVSMAIRMPMEAMQGGQRGHQNRAPSNMQQRSFSQQPQRYGAEPSRYGSQERGPAPAENTYANRTGGNPQTFRGSPRNTPEQGHKPALDFPGDDEAPF